MPSRPKIRSLSIHLLKSDILSANDAVKDDPNVRRTAIGHGRGFIGVLYHRLTPARAPRWLSLFHAHVDPAEFLSSSISALFIVSAGARLFALSFGQGRHLLAPGSYVEDFGLKVTLNSVSPEAIRSIDRKALDATGLHSRDQASKNIPIIEFGLDIEKDILRAVTGPPKDDSLGIRLAGSDALSITSKMELVDLSVRLPKYLRQYGKKDYQRHYPWVDNIRELSDPVQCSELDCDLERRIRSRELERIWMAVPDLVDWHDVAGFTYSRSESSDPLDDIGFDSYLASLETPESISIDSLRKNRVYCISGETDLPKADWPVHKCIYAEIEWNHRTFLLNNGRWYEVASDYVREVDNAIRRIPASQTLRLPGYRDLSEADYNSRVYNLEPEKYALMDRKMIPYGGGSSKIEFCDLYTRSRQMVHVKRYGGSGTLSHLFAQGVVSASLFLNDHRFRSQVNKLLPTSHKFSPAADVRRSDYEVAYAIASKASERLTLPFFSRITLRSVSRQLRNIGYQVTLNKIPCL